uniref:aldo-keto reductase family 1 member B1-like n=1 Tax=Styela clava TaxID=7725 RepID=UPI001939B163|nr:aldo-keto reductase family 1 member B1-like [Styela clava]
MSTSNMKRLSTGSNIPMLGLGTWKSQPGEVKAAVETAIDEGYRHIDCALLYDNENEVGEAIEIKIKEGKVKREDLFITTKLWSTYYRKVREGFDKSLRRLKLEYVDLYMLHWPFALQFTTEKDFFPVDDQGNAKLDEDIDYIEVYREIEKLQKKGLTKAIGLSSFNEYQIDRIFKEVDIKPAVHQFEIHPYLDQESLVKHSQSKGMVVTGYSTFGSPDRPWAQPGDPTLLDNPELQNIADKYGKTVAQVLLRYQLQRDIVVIPKSVTASRIKSNAAVFDFNLEKEDMTRIKKFNRNWRAVSVPAFTPHKYYPFKEKYTE